MEFAKAVAARRAKQILIDERARLGLFARLHGGDPTAADDCLRTYGAYVRELAKYNTNSDEEGEALAAGIFEDIEAFARGEHGLNTRKAEIELIRQIAVRRIVKQRWDGRKLG